MRVLYVATDLRDADILRQEVRRVEPGLTLDICAGLSELRARPDQPSNYDVLLMDCGLAEPEQLQLIHYVRVRQLGMPVVALSQTNGPVPTAALSAGVDDYLVRGPKFADRLGPALRLSADRYRTVSNTLREFEKVKRSEARLRLIIEALPTGVVLLDQTGKVLAMNMAGVHHFSISSPTDIVGRPFTTLMPMEDQPAMQEFLAKAIGGEEASVQFALTRDEEGKAFNLRGLCIQKDAAAGQSSVLGVLERVNGNASLMPAWNHDFDLDVSALTSSSSLPPAPLDDHLNEELTARVRELEARGQGADKRIGELEAELLRVRGSLEQAQVRESSGAEQLKRAHDEASQLVVESGSLRQALWNEQEQRTAAEDAARKAEAQARAIEEQVKQAEERVREQENLVRTAAERTRTLEEQTRALEIQTGTLNEQARTASEEARLAEERARAAEEQAHRAEEHLRDQLRESEQQRLAVEEQRRAIEEQSRSLEEQKRIMGEQRLASEAHVRSVEEQRHAAEEGMRIVDEQRRVAEDHSRAMDERRRQADEQAQAAHQRAQQAEEAMQKSLEQLRVNDEQTSLAREQLRTMEEELRQARERASGFEQQLQQAHERASAFEQQLQQTHDQLRTAEERAVQAGDHHRGAEEQLRQAHERAQGLEAELHQAQERAQGLAGELHQAQEQLRVLGERLAQAGDQQRGAEDQLREAHARAQGLETELHQAQEQLRVVGESLAQAGEQQRAAEDQLREAHARAQGLETELHQAQEQLRVVGESLAQAGDQQRAAEEQLREAHARAQGLEAESHQAQEQLREQQRAAEQQSREAHERAQGLEGELHQARELLRVVEESLAQAGDQQRGAEEQLREAHARAQGLEGELHQAREQLRVVEESLAQAGDQQRGAEEQLRQAHERVQGLEGQLHQAHELQRSAEEQMRQAYEQMRAAEEHAAVVGDQQRTAEVQLRQAQTEGKVLDAQLLQTREQVRAAEEHARQMEARAQSAEEQARLAAEAQHGEALATVITELQQARAELAASSESLEQQRAANEQLQQAIGRKDAQVAELELRAQTRISGIEQEHRVAVERLQELLEQAVKDQTASAPSPASGGPLARTGSTGVSQADATKRGYERIGRLATAMSDNLLAAIQTARDTARAVLEVLPAGSEGHNQALKTLEAVEKCNELARHLFRLSSRHASQTSRVDLTQLVRHQEALLLHLAGPDIELQFDLALGLSSTELDAQDVTQVLTSLIVAARDALPLGGVIRIGTAYQHRAHDSNPDAARGGERPRPLMLGVTAKGYGIRPVSSATCEEVTSRCGGTLTTVIEPNVSWTLIAMLPGGVADPVETLDSQSHHSDLTRTA